MYETNTFNIKHINEFLQISRACKWRKRDGVSPALKYSLGSFLFPICEAISCSVGSLTFSLLLLLVWVARSMPTTVLLNSKDSDLFLSAQQLVPSSPFHSACTPSSSCQASDSLTHWPSYFSSDSHWQNGFFRLYESYVWKLKKNS